MSTTEIIERARALLALDDPTEDEILDSARRLAAAKLRVRDLPPWRPAQASRVAIPKDPAVDRAHQAVLAARSVVQAGDGSLADKKRLARAQLAEMLAARRAGFGGYDDYRRACRPRTSFTASAFNRLRSYRELAMAEAEWSRVRRALLGDVVIDLTGPTAVIAVSV
jgi:hypothetical protein